MSRGRIRAFTLVAAIAASAAVAVPAVGSAGEARTAKAPVKVDVFDNFFAPTSVKIKKGRSVKWVWSEFNTQTHNVRLTKVHPKGVKPKQFRSANGVFGIRFKRKFTVAGKYGFLCTFHVAENMRMTVKVKK